MVELIRHDGELTAHRFLWFFIKGENMLTKEEIQKKVEPVLSSHKKDLYKVVIGTMDGFLGFHIIITSRNEEDISLDDLACINEELIDLLDSDLPVGYSLGVSSKGLEYDLESLDEIKDSIGKYVYVKLYCKEPTIKDDFFYGVIEAIADDNISFLIKIKTREITLQLNYKQIAKIRTAVKF